MREKERQAETKKSNKYKRRIFFFKLKKKIFKAGDIDVNKNITSKVQASRSRQVTPPYAQDREQ